MKTIESNKLKAVINENAGGSIVSLKLLSDGTEFTHRTGLQSWIKSGDRIDPASGVISTYYAGIADPEFDIIESESNKVVLRTILQELQITKTIEVIGNKLNVALWVKNISSGSEIELQLENFNNLAGAGVMVRENSAVFLASDNEISGHPVYFEKYAQRYVKTYKHNGESIIVANTKKKSYLEIIVAEKVESLALVVHANRLCWGINTEKKILCSGEEFSSELSFVIHNDAVTDCFNLPQRVKNSTKKEVVDFDKLFTGGSAFEERWSHLCLQYDRTDPDDIKKIIAELLVPMRYTGVVLELERGVKLNSHPELAADFALDIDVIKDIADFVKRCGLKVGVEFNTPGHQNETGIADIYPELLEPKPANLPGYVLCVTNPDVRKLVSEIILEIQEFIQPDMFFLGGDEVQFSGYKGSVFGHCKLCRGAKPHERFADYLEWLQEIIDNDVQVSIAGDMFLKYKQFGDVVEGNGSEGDAWKAISSIRKTTTILDWHYYPTDEYRSLDYFKGLGYDVWPVTAFTFDGLRNFLCYAEKIGIKRAMHTTWSVPNAEKLFVETMFWAGCYHWLGKRADNIPVREMAVDFSRRFW
jgi:hypothetical protein